MIHTRNAGTRIAEAVQVPRLDPGELFVGAYERIAEPCRAFAQPGLALVAVDDFTGCPTMTRLRSRARERTAAIVGRHDQCDLYLSASDQLPLRHLAVILDPAPTWEAGRSSVEYRILDLRTERGFEDEHGGALRGLRCDGAAVVRIPGYTLFVLPLGDPTDWPTDGADAWSYLPERVYFDEVMHAADGSSTRVPNLREGSARRTRVTAIHGPRESTASLVAADVAGTLELVSPSRRELIPVGHAALRDGVLLGRYARCDTHAVIEESISRVHALIIRIADDLIIVDTASTHGTHRAGHVRARVHALDATTDLMLGPDTRLTWRWLA